MSHVEFTHRYVTPCDDPDQFRFLVENVVGALFIGLGKQAPVIASTTRLIEEPVTVPPDRIEDADGNVVFARENT